MQAEMSQVFPGVTWMGGSDIHVSFCGGGTLNIPFSDRAKVISLLSKYQVAQQIWRTIQRRVGAMEFLLDEETFCSLFLIDINRNLMSQATTVTPDRIRNPATGNLFHKVALMPPYMGGVRFWADEYGDGTLIGFRFRIVKINPNEEPNIREEARERVAAVLAEVDSVYDSMMDIQEPSKNEDATMKQLLTAMEV